MDLPIFELEINESPSSDTGVFAVSIVNNPAIEEKALFFNKNKVDQKFKMESEEERIISTPILVADKKIYRNNEEFGEHYIVFTKDTIKKIMQKYFALGLQSNSNLEHNPLLALNGVTMFESFQINRERGINPPKEFEHLSDGSWYGSMKVTDSETWELIKDGEFKGVSVEGSFQYKMEEQKEPTEEEKLIDELIGIIEDLEKNNNN